MDGGEGGYVDEIILWGGARTKENPQKNKNFHEENLFFSGIVRNVDYQAWRLIGLA